MKYQLELLTPERVLQLWPELKPYLDRSCASNAVGQTDITAEDIYMLALVGVCAIFCITGDGEVVCVVAIQFTETNGHKGADIIALAAKDLMKIKPLFWDPIQDWLRLNGVEFIDIYSSERLVPMYERFFGFDRSCVMLRKVL
jgi:hypothetical protein